MGTMRILRQIRLELSLVSTIQLISVLIYMVAIFKTKNGESEKENGERGTRNGESLK